MKQRILAVICALILAASQLSTYGETSDNRDHFTDTWVATDGLGRVMPDNKKAGDKREDKYAGIFYFLFLDTSYEGRRLNDKSLAYRLGGKEAVWDVLVRNGIDMWGKPYFGYYENQDEWVYRKHAHMLTAAGIDFIFLDITNPNMYASAWKTLFKVWQQIRDEGGQTPQIIFHCGDDPERMASHMNTLWNELYGKGKYQDLWFMWEGKPLIFGNPALLEEQQKAFFTVRRSWAFNTWTEDEGGLGRWPWIAEYPQTPGKNISGAVEQVSVAAGFHASTSRGRSFVDGIQTSNGKKDFGYSLEETDYGLTFKQQWEHALSVDPPLVTITGWNEFHNGGSFASADDISWHIADTYHSEYDDLQYGKIFVDCFSPEFSRDIEPIEGFYGDNYYYQLCYYLRLFKGVDKIPEGTGSREIDINGGTDQWDNILPVFADIVNDTGHRDHRSVTGIYQYTNTSGRNDIVFAKVSKLKERTYFFISCKDDIVYDDGENWMNLFIDADQNYETGWEGYDFIVNRSRDGKYMSVEKFIDNSWLCEEAGKAEYAVSGNTMTICLPNDIAGLSDRDNFDFKWADNSTVTGNVMAFMDLGDSAPDNRFNFRYIKQGGDIVNVKKDINMTVVYTVAVPVLIVLLIAGYLVVLKKKTGDKALFKKRVILSAVTLVTVAAVTAGGIFFGMFIKERKTITLMIRTDISPNSDMKLLDKTIEDYIAVYKKESKGVNVRVVYVKDFPANPVEADVLLIPADSALEYMASPGFDGKASASLFADLSQKDLNREAILEPALKMGDIKGSIQWIPFNYDRAVVICDLNVFETLNVGIPVPDWTYDDFVKTVNDLTQKRDKVSYTGVYLPYHENFVWKLFVRGFGGEWFDEENYALVLTEGNSLSGLNSMFSLLNTGVAQANGFDIKGSANAHAGMSVAFACQPERNGMYHLSDDEAKRNPANRAAELADENKLLILPLPSFPEGNAGISNTEFIHGFAVTASSKKKDKAIDFALFSQTAEGQRILNRYYGGIPTNIAAQKEDFWKTGILMGANADNVLAGIDYDERDDFFNAFYDSQNIYEDILRTRVMFQAKLFRDFETVKKGNKDGLSNEGIAILKDLEEKVGLVMKLADRR